MFQNDLFEELLFRLQAYVQCNDDNVDRETQSEEIEMRTKWVQHSPEGFICCGGKMKQ